MKFSNFKYWFYYKNQDEYYVFLKETKSYVCLINNETLVITDLQDKHKDSVEGSAIQMEFNMYKNRDEYAVGRKAEVNGDTESMKAFYKKLINGVLKIKTLRDGINPDELSDSSNVLSWLDSTDFFIAPASTLYHDNFTGGLLSHTLNVYNRMLDLIQIPEFSNVKIESACLCALVHDWCKINTYESYKRNVKNEVTGKWEQVDAYRRGTFENPFGHGVASMYMAMKFFKLTDEEALAIRWHMGRWNVCELEFSELTTANYNYPIVHLIQFADQLAITNY